MLPVEAVRRSGGLLRGPVDVSQGAGHLREPDQGIGQIGRRERRFSLQPVPLVGAQNSHLPPIQGGNCDQPIE